MCWKEVREHLLLVIIFFLKFLVNSVFIIPCRCLILILYFCLIGGYYYGKIKFPPEYPYKPPGITYVLLILQNLVSIPLSSRFIVKLPMNHVLFFCFCFRMTTPNGRFITQKKICLSMSDCKLNDSLSICSFVAIKCFNI